MKTFLFLLSVFLSVSSLEGINQTLSTYSILAPTVQKSVEKDLFKIVNQNRETNDLCPLQGSIVISQLARQHSLDMARYKIPFGIQKASQIFLSVKELIPEAKLFGVNIAHNRRLTNPAQGAIAIWANSPSQWAQVMGDFNLTGIGVVKDAQGEYYFTQIFIKAE